MSNTDGGRYVASIVNYIRRRQEPRCARQGKPPIIQHLNVTSNPPVTTTIFIYHSIILSCRPFPLCRLSMASARVRIDSYYYDIMRSVLRKIIIGTVSKGCHDYTD